MINSANLGAELLKVYQGEKSTNDELNTYNAEIIKRDGKVVKAPHDFTMMFHTNLEMVLNMMESTAFQKK